MILMMIFFLFIIRYRSTSVYFVFELRIFVVLENTNDICYFCLLFCFENIFDDGKQW